MFLQEQSNFFIHWSCWPRTSDPLMDFNPWCLYWFMAIGANEWKTLIVLAIGHFFFYHHKCAFVTRGLLYNANGFDEQLTQESKKEK